MIHPQLAADTHPIAEWPRCHVLLHRNAILPWLILVPKTDAADLLQLPRAERELVMNEAGLVAEFIQEHWQLQKVNFAQLGNVVPQMHLHIIGRSPQDDCWPKPVWGNLSGNKSYSDEELQDIARKLGKKFDQAYLR